MGWFAVFVFVCEIKNFWTETFCLWILRVVTGKILPNSSSLLNLEWSQIAKLRFAWKSCLARQGPIKCLFKWWPDETMFEYCFQHPLSVTVQLNIIIMQRQETRQWSRKFKERKSHQIGSCWRPFFSISSSGMPHNNWTAMPQDSLRSIISH